MLVYFSSFIKQQNKECEINHLETLNIAGLEKLFITGELNNCSYHNRHIYLASAHQRIIANTEKLILDSNKTGL